MPFGGALTVGLIGAGSGIFSGLFGGSSAKKAAQIQADAANRATDLSKQIWEKQQQNMAPYLSAGQNTISSLMTDLQPGGRFGHGSLPSVPQFTGEFHAPTLEEARSSPGYEFTREQGTKAILQGAAAAGGSISGGTLKSLDQFSTGLTDSTYNDVFNRSLSTYNEQLAKYQAQLQGYDQSLRSQQQEFNMPFNVAALGEGGVQSINNSGTAAANNIGNLMTQVGNAGAAGVIGQANAFSSGFGNASNSVLQSLLLRKLLPGPGATGTVMPPTPGTIPGVDTSVPVPG